MKFHYLVQHDANKKLILFLNGWGMNEATVRHLEAPRGYDVVVGYDYREFTDCCTLASGYDQVVLFAWSIGVWATERLAVEGLLPQTFRKVAFAGSPLIRHNQFGIPEATFDLTLQNLSETSREVFNRRMVGGRRLKKLFDEFAKRPTEELRSELERVRDIELNRPIKSPIVQWDGLVIATRDRIIPCDNLVRFATTYQIPIHELTNSEHFLFANFSSWSELLELFPF